MKMVLIRVLLIAVQADAEGASSSSLASSQFHSKLQSFICLSPPHGDIFVIDKIQKYETILKIKLSKLRHHIF